MPLDGETYVPRSDEDIAAIIETELVNEFGEDTDLTDGSVFTTLTNTLSQTHADNQELSLRDVYEAGYLDTATGENLDRVVANVGITRTPATHATGVVEFSRDETASQDYVIQKGTRVETDGDNPVTFETTESVTLESGTSSVNANIRATEGGARGNVGANTIVVMPSPPTGIDSVTNPNPTGDSSYTDTNGDPYVVGRDEESDDELRERVKQTLVGGGSATVDALLSALLHSDDKRLVDVQSVTLYNNRTNNDNTGSGGLPPKSFEMVVHGGEDVAIGEAIFDTMAVTDRSYGGAHGTETSVSVTAINGQTETVYFSRPSALNVDMTLDIVHDDTYVGDDNLRDIIIDYVGGTDTDGNAILGTGVGEDVIVDEITNIVVGDDTGVEAITSFTSTPSVTTDSDGVEVIAVGNNEVAQTDGTDGSIAFNKTQR